MLLTCCRKQVCQVTDGPCCIDGQYKKHHSVCRWVGQEAAQGSSSHCALLLAHSRLLGFLSSLIQSVLLNVNRLLLCPLLLLLRLRRAAAGPCDAEEYCTGDSASCPLDVYKHAGWVCKCVAAWGLGLQAAGTPAAASIHAHDECCQQSM